MYAAGPGHKRAKRCTGKESKRTSGKSQTKRRYVRAQGYGGVSDSEGNFRFEGIEPGDYNLSGERSGFLNTYFGAAGPYQPGTRLTLQPGQHLTDLTLALIPQATVSGKIVDEDGDPVGGVMVQAIAQSWGRGKLRYLPHGSSSTDDHGEYRISNLPPGRYFIYCQKREMMGSNDIAASPDKPDIRPIRTFYPDAITRDAATQIPLKAGQDGSGIDIRLRTAQTHHVRGKVVGELPEGDPERLMLNISAQDDSLPMMFGGPAATLNKNRNFDLAGVAPGAYTLSLISMSGRLRSFGRQSIEVGASDLDGVILTVGPVGSVRGRIQMEGTPSSGAGPANLAQVRPYFVPADSTGFYGGANTNEKADGTFIVENVSPGNYFVQARNGPEGTYLKSIRFGQQEVLGREIDLTQNASAEVGIVFRYGAATVTGTVQSPKSAPVPSDASAAQTAPPPAQVVIVPEFLGEDGSGLRFANANQYGAFTVKSLAPGRYRAYAFEQMATDQLQNPAVLKLLESRGIELDLKEGDQKQIQLPVLARSDSDQLLATLGIDPQ